MRFMMLVKTTGEFSGPPPQALIDAINKQGEAAVKSGAMIATGGLAPVTASTTVRVAQNKVTTTDGPFTEAKEVVGGFAIFRSEVQTGSRRKRTTIHGAPPKALARVGRSHGSPADFRRRRLPAGLSLRSKGLTDGKPSSSVMDRALPVCRAG